MEDTPAIAAPPATAAPDKEADTQSQPAYDVSDLTLEQAEALFRGESVEVPVKAGGEGKTEAPPAAKVEAKAGDKPPETKTPAAEVEVEETRTPEEVEAAVAQARADSVEAGQDEAAQEAAADAAAVPPAAPVVQEPAGIERPRLKDERDQLIAGIYMKAKREGKPISWADAEARVDGPKPEVKEPVVEPPVDYAGQITTLEGEIAGLEKELADYEGLSTPDIRKLQDNIWEKKSELRDTKKALDTAAKQAEQAEAAALAVSDANREKAHGQALVEYPAIADDTTVLGRAIAKRVEEMKDKKHPDHALLFSDSCPLIIARNVATELGIQPVARKKAPVSSPAKPTVEAPPRKVVSPAPGNKTAVVPGQPAEDGKAQLETALHGDVELADLDAIQGMPDPNKLLVGALR